MDISLEYYFYFLSYNIYLKTVIKWLFTVWVEEKVLEKESIKRQFGIIGEQETDLTSRKCFKKRSIVLKVIHSGVILFFVFLLGFFYQYFLSVHVPSIIFKIHRADFFSFFKLQNISAKSKSNMYNNMRINHETTVLRLNSEMLSSTHCFFVSLSKACPELGGSMRLDLFLHSHLLLWTYSCVI